MKFAFFLQVLYFKGHEGGHKFGGHLQTNKIEKTPVIYWIAKHQYRNPATNLSGVSPNTDGI